MKWFPTKQWGELKDVHCPRCREKGVYVGGKACCAKCGWNVGNVRKHVKRSIGQAIVVVAVMTGSWWATMPDGRMGLFVILPAVFFALISIGPWIPEIRRIPPIPPSPEMSAEVEFRVLSRPRLVRKRVDGSVAGQILAIPFMVFLLWTFFREYDRWAGISGRFGLYLVCAYIAWSLISHVTFAVRLAREWTAEAHLVRRTEATMGRVVDQSPGRIKYEFRDNFNNLRRGAGNDHSHLLFEDMQVAVLYDPDDSGWNLPACGLNFHVIASDSPAVVTA